MYQAILLPLHKQLHMKSTYALWDASGHNNFRAFFINVKTPEISRDCS